MKITRLLLISAILTHIFWAHAVSAQELASASGSLIKIYAAGTSSPTIHLKIKDSKVATFTNVRGNTDERQFEEFQYQANESIQASQVKIQFTNDIGPSRDVRIDKISIDGVYFETESETTYMQSESADCTSGYLQTEWMYCNSTMQYDHLMATPTPTPTIIATPTATPTPVCPQKAIGDADCNNTVDIVDFEIWRREYSSLRYTGFADFDTNGNVTAVDFEIWRKTFYKLNIK